MNIQGSKLEEYVFSQYTKKKIGGGGVEHGSVHLHLRSQWLLLIMLFNAQQKQTDKSLILVCLKLEVHCPVVQSSFKLYELVKRSTR